MKSLLYYSPALYELLIKILHADERYKVISSLIGNKSVCELGCGTGLLQGYLHSNQYHGFDLNERFVEYGRKKGRNIFLGDINKIVPDAEVIVLIDVLHHLPNHKEVLRNLCNLGEVIVCEPFNTLPSPLNSLIHIFDGDGINPKTEWYDKEKLIDFFASFGAKKLIHLNNNIIAVFR